MLKCKRSEKIALEIKEIIAETVLTDMRDPRIGFVTITDVGMSNDLRMATVYFSVFGDEKEEKGVNIALNRAKGFFQKRIAGILQLRYTPKLRFLPDRSVRENLKIDAIINQIHSEEHDDEKDTQ